tara:strand:+ start:395 stop:1684 length:1290 start_codon:yes stop_codon:yes gene_type:complete
MLLRGTYIWRTLVYRAPRGTTDILPEDQRYWTYVHSVARNVVNTYGYRRVDTPIFEQTDLFTRGVGEVTDIVEKEMYSFLDRGGDSITLRPEGTASVCRSYLEHGMHNLPQPVRLFYSSPTFRYERPQAGRFRQHHQFGVEALGEPDSYIDTEIIDMAWKFMGQLGLKNLRLLVNNIGDSECRPHYLESLKSYYSDQLGLLCKDCNQRVIRNPLRLLDCKQQVCSQISETAPRSIDFLCIDCKYHWDTLVAYLDRIDLPYSIEHRLVRGLDYYTRTVFEIQPENAGSQSTILAGGRYDGLIEELKGRPTPGIGFATGIERIILALRDQQIPIPEEDSIKVVLTYMGDEAKMESVYILASLHEAGINAVMAPSGKSLRSQMRYANNIGVSYVLVLGQDELDKGSLVLRDMAGGSQRMISLESVVQEVSNI